MTNKMLEGLKFLEDLEEFITLTFGVSLAQSQEEPHVFSFLDYCVERPPLWRPDGARLQGPVRQTLPSRVRFAALHAEEFGFPITITGRSIQYAVDLIRQYAKREKGARAILPSELEVIADSADRANPFGLRFLAAVRCLWETWARPSELLRRIYPDDFSADYDEGIVITVPVSKTNQCGNRPEFFTIPHYQDINLCPACTLRDWRDWLGEDYRGPMFTTLDRHTMLPTGHILYTSTLTDQLKQHGRKVRIETNRLGSYSLRKGPATDAIANGGSWGHTSRRLRHHRIDQTLAYVDPAVLFERVRSL